MSVDDAVIEAAARAGLGDPTGVVMPQPDDAEETRNWLLGDGAAAVAMVTEPEPLARGDRDACEAVMAELDGAGSPQEMMVAAAGTPDLVTAEVLLGLHRMLSSVLSGCGDEEAFDAAVPEFAWQWVLVQRRLAQVGVSP